MGPELVWMFDSLREFVVERRAQQVVAQQEGPPLHLGFLPSVFQLGVAEDGEAAETTEPVKRFHTQEGESLCNPAVRQTHFYGTKSGPKGV